MLLELVSIAANSAHIDIIRFSFIFSEIEQIFFVGLILMTLNIYISVILFVFISLLSSAFDP